MIKILVDSTCDLPKDFMEEHDIGMLPLRVSLEGKEYLDKITISVEDVYSAMRKGVVPKTSQPNPSDIQELFRKYCQKGHDFIYLSFSAVLSSTYQVAQSVLQEFQELYPSRKMEIVDSKSGSTAIGLIARKAVFLTENTQLSFESVVDRVKKYVEHIEHIFTIDDLSWLIKGGRISKTQGTIGTILSVKPILEVNNGYIEPIEKVRGRKKALNAVVDIFEQRANEFQDQVIGISHADDPETAQTLMELIEERFGSRDFMVNKIGSVLGTHLGIGGVGVFFFSKDVDTEFE